MAPLLKAGGRRYHGAPQRAYTGQWPMPLLLVHPSVDLTLELYVSPALEEAIALQWERVRQRTVRDTYVQALEYRLQDLLRECLDWDLKPPTEAQLSYATLLAARHAISLPSEARKYRFHTAMFIEAWARKRTGDGQADVGNSRRSGIVESESAVVREEPSAPVGDGRPPGN